MTPAEIKTATDQIDAHMLPIAITGAMALLLGFVQYGEIIRLGFRDRSHATLAFTVMFHLANDVHYTLNFDRWFNEIGHPFFMNQWYLIFPFTILEAVVAFQIVEFSRKEVFPGLSKPQAYFAFGGLLLAMFAFYWWLSGAMRDYYHFYGNMITIILSNCGIFLLLRRGNRKGQSLLLAGVLVLCAGPPQFFIHFPSLSTAFQTPAFYAVGAVVVAVQLLYFVLLARAPRYDRKAQA